MNQFSLRSGSASGKYSSNFIKVLAVTFLGFLNLGYLGVNQLDMNQLSIISIRLLAFLIICALLSMQGTRIFKIDRPIFIFGLVTIVGAVTSFISLNLLFIFLFLMGARSFSIYFLATASVCILGITIVASVLLVYFGIVENNIDIVGSTFGIGDELRSRMTFGFRNVNAFSAVVSAFCLLFILVSKRAVVGYSLALIISYAFYIYTDSRTMLLATVFSIIFTVMFLLLASHRRIFYFTSIFIISAPLVLTALATTIVNQFPFIDLLISSRFTFSSAYFSGIPVFRLLIGGIDPPSELTIDNSFALITGAAGIPFLVYIAIRVFHLVKQCALDFNYKTYSFTLSFWLFSFSESSMVRPESLICLIFWMLILTGNNFKYEFNPRKLQ